MGVTAIAGASHARGDDQSSEASGKNGIPPQGIVEERMRSHDARSGELDGDDPRRDSPLKPILSGMAAPSAA